MEIAPGQYGRPILPRRSCLKNKTGKLLGPFRTKQGFFVYTKKLTPPGTSIGLKLNGYYYYEYFKKSSLYRTKLQEVHPMILYKDGTLKFYMNFNLDFIPNDTHIKQTPLSIKHREFEEYINDSQQNAYSNEHPAGWGHYKIRQDSIFFLFYWYGPSNFRDYYLYEGKGLILNDTTFVLTDIYNKENPFKLDSKRTYKFRKYHFKPDSSNVTHEFLK